MTTTLRERLRAAALADTGDRGWRIENAADGDGSAANVYLYAPIGGWFGVYADEVVDQIEGLDVEQIYLYVNSPGGDVYEALAIMNVLARHPARVVATVDGMAASAASYIIQAADEIVMGRGSELMIHDASTIAWGNPTDLAKARDHVERISQNIAALYAEHAGGTADEWRQRMKDETWFTAAEAVAAGLADRVLNKTPKPPADNAVDWRAMFDRPARTQDAAAPAARPSQPTPARRAVALSTLDAIDLAAAAPQASAASSAPTSPAVPVGSVDPAREEGGSLMDPIRAALIERLSLEADADDEAILAAVANLSTETPAAGLPDGVVMIAEPILAQLQADAAAGREAREAQIVAHREDVVDTAIRMGRLGPANRDHFLTLHKADPEGTEAIIDSLPVEGFVPLKAKGYTGGVDESAGADDVMFSKTYPTSKEA